MRITEALSFSPVESRRFGLRVFRGSADEILPQKLTETILTENIDLSILRMPAENQESISSLRHTGFPFLVTDLLVYYFLDNISDYLKPVRNSGLKFVPFSEEYADDADRLMEMIFKGYRNNYTANPYLNADIVDIYKEWAVQQAWDRAAGKVAWLVRKGDAYAGFISCSIQDGKLEIILNGVAPQESGKGIYGDMIRFVKQFAVENGCRQISVSTQSNNYAVQKVWSREGLVFRRAFFTVHVNSFLNVSRLVRKTIPITRDAIDCSREKEREAWIEILLRDFYPELQPFDHAILNGFSGRLLSGKSPSGSLRLEVSFPVVERGERESITLVKLMDSMDTVSSFAYFYFQGEI